MSNERDQRSDLADVEVSRVYRQLADERPPEHLSRSVLDEAIKAVRPRYARSRAWTRPLAWAATVALSVAIVLEFGREPVQEPLPAEEPGVLRERDSVFDAADVQLLTQAEGIADLQAGTCLLYTSPSPRDATLSRMPSSA